MPHPHLSRVNARRAAAVSLLGAAVLLPTGALAQAVPNLGVDDVGVCAQADDLLALPVAAADADPACDVVDDAAATGAEALATPGQAVQAVQAIAEDVPAPVGEPAPVADAVQEGSDGAPQTGESNQGADAVAPTPPAAQTAQASDEPTPAEVKAAGMNVDEVIEPAAPPADGRADEGTALAPAVNGTNMAGIRSQSGVTLQPYLAPMVSTPAPAAMAPEFATTGPVSTVVPAQEAAAELLSLTGTALVPYATGPGAWVSAAGMGLLAAGAVVWRRRADELDTATIGM